MVTETKQQQGFDDKLFKEFNTIEVLVTDNTFKPKNNHFYETITTHLNEVEYNPEKEKEAYNYQKILEIRRRK
jgi:hypothetical protein